MPTSTSTPQQRKSKVFGQGQPQQPPAQPQTGQPDVLQQLLGMGVEYGRSVMKDMAKQEAQVRLQQKLEAEAAGVPPSETLKTLVSMYQPIDPLAEMRKLYGADGQAGGASAAPQPPGQTAAGPSASMTPTAPSTSTSATRASAPAEALAGRQQTPAGSNVRTPRNIMEALFQQSGYDPATGQVRTGGQFNLGPSMSDIATAQKITGEEPLQAGEREKLEISAQNALELEVVKAGAKNREELQKKLESAQRVTSDISSIVDIFDQIPTGPVTGRMAGGLAAISGGREKFAQLETMSASLVFSLGEYITGQGGRSLSENEQKTLRNIFGFDKSMTANKFMGKLQAAIQLINNRLPEGAVKLPPARQFLQMVRQQRSAGASGRPSAQDATSAQSRGAVGYDTERSVFVNAQGEPV